MWLTGLVALRHVGSSRTRARTRVPCIGRQILNHCATREALICILLISFCNYLFLILLISSCWICFLGKRVIWPIHPTHTHTSLNRSRLYLHSSILRILVLKDTVCGRIKRKHSFAFYFTLHSLQIIIPILPPPI